MAVQVVGCVEGAAEGAVDNVAGGVVDGAGSVPDVDVQ